VRQRRSRGLSLLALQCEEDCVWEEAQGEGEQEKEEDRSREQHVWCVRRSTHISKRVAALQRASSPDLPSSPPAPLGPRDHAARLDSPPGRCSPAGADGALGARVRLPASPLRGHGASPVCGAERMPLRHAHLQHRAQRGGAPPLRAGVQR